MSSFIMVDDDGVSFDDLNSVSLGKWISIELEEVEEED